MTHVLGVRREEGNMLHRDYVGISFPFSLLTTSKMRGLLALQSHST